ncbi:MAG: DUF1801 domain-containing protein [Ignavibacteriales bacterium]|nr:DUF1801 domain-containing protein [Ignavibacteriales bacterium]
MKSPINNITMEEFLASLPKKEREITLRLRKIVAKAAPELKERFSYGVPFYFGKQRVCFIWPSSAPFGKNNSSVEFGFCRGNLLSDEHKILEHGTRKQVYMITYTSTQQIQKTILKEYIEEALVVDEMYSGKIL